MLPLTLRRTAAGDFDIAVTMGTRYRQGKSRNQSCLCTTYMTGAAIGTGRCVIRQLTEIAGDAAQTRPPELELTRDPFEQESMPR